MTTTNLEAPTATTPQVEQSAPASVVPRLGPLDGADIETVIAALSNLPVPASRSAGRAAQRLSGARRVLAWLNRHPGQGWQQRWLSSNADAGTGWIQAVTAEFGSWPPVRRELVTDGVVALLLGRVVVPGYEFLHHYRPTALFREAKVLFGRDTLDRLRQAADQAGHTEGYQREAECCLVKIMFRTGRDLDELSAGDLLEFRDWNLQARGKIPTGLHAAWDLLRETGVLSEALPLRRVGQGQLSTAQLVDRYKIQCKPIRDMLIRYLDERRPMLDYGTLQDW